MTHSISAIEMTPKLRDIINSHIPKRGSIGRGWFPEEHVNRNCDAVNELAINILKDKLKYIFEEIHIARIEHGRNKDAFKEG